MRRAKSALIVFLLAAVILVAAPVSSGTANAATSKELRRKLFSLTNSARRSNHMRPLMLNWRLSRSAVAHARRMANRHSVYHSANLYKLVRPFHPTSWGENVGMAGSVRRIHRLYMRSPAHRSNILRNAFSRVGIGVVQRGSRVWTTVIFYGG